MLGVAQQLLPRFYRRLQAAEDERRIGQIILETACSEDEARASAGIRLLSRTADGHDPAHSRAACNRQERHGCDRAYEAGRFATSEGGPRRAPSLRGNVRSRFAATSAAIGSSSRLDERTSTGV
jgi:hypothetical protein